MSVMNVSEKLPEPNYDESKIPPYVLPEPLVTIAGIPVLTPQHWYDFRRDEILELFKSFVYGKMPETTPPATFDVSSVNKNALNGSATRKDIKIFLIGDPAGPSMDLTLYLPNNAAKPVPVFLGMNFYGNQTVWDDPEIPLPQSWVRNREEWGITENRATDSSRGQRKNRWPVDQILARGYGLAVAYYGDVEPDEPQLFDQSIRKALLRPGQQHPDNDEWGAIGAWAWGLSRAMDYLEKDPDVDSARVAVMGHSRLGKTALWAGATDQRFAAVISNNSGCGGAALSRRIFGETLKLINDRFPHWFCGNFKKYNGHESECPVDQHMLLALIAPRPLYVASAEQDLWADPRGEFLSAVHATPVYRLLGEEGLPTNEMPQVNQPVVGTIGYHIRTGEHDVTAYDWQCYMDFCDHNWPRIREVKKIWDAAEHNAFTDLIRFQNKWYCTFREADQHVPGRDGVIRIIVSADGDRWDSASVIEEKGVDLRDPKLSITPEGRLMLLVGGSVYENGKFITRQTRVSFSTDGVTWSPLQKVLEEGDWLWRVTWHKGTAYGVAYITKEKEENISSKIRLVKSSNGIDYELVTYLEVSGEANETTLRFLDDDTMMALVRRDGADRTGVIGTSMPPYTEWSWRNAGHALGGPDFLHLANGKCWAGSRILGQDVAGNGVARTCLARLDQWSYRPMLILPSGGDTSYPALVWHDDMLWMSYYSSHEGKTAIYLAKIQVPR